MENMPRPGAEPSPVARVLDWIAWVGVARLVASTLAIGAVALGALWLTRAPRPASEAALPTPSVVGDLGSTLPPPAVQPADPVTVHVVGAVARPGVYELPAGSRVGAAVEQAGGATPAGDPDAINLAAVVDDGARIYVPEVGEELPALDAGGGPTTAPGPVDVNRASATELDGLPGVGPATATAIVTERERNGPFASVDDLLRVPGIGPARLDALRELVRT